MRKAFFSRYILPEYIGQGESVSHGFYALCIQFGQLVDIGKHALHVLFGFLFFCPGQLKLCQNSHVFDHLITYRRTSVNGAGF